MEAVKPTYYSTIKLANAVTDEYPNAKSIDVIFEPTDKKRGKFDEYKIKPFGMIIHEHVGNTHILKYSTMLEKFGKVHVSFGETKTRKINFNKRIQILKISTNVKEFEAEDGKTIQYVPTNVVNPDAALNSIIAKLQDFHKEYNNATESVVYNLDEDCII